MKILVFAPYYPPHIGGLESHADEFNKYLSREGVTITVFTPRLPKDSLKREILHKNVSVIRFPAVEIVPNFPLPKFWSLKFWQIFRALFKQDFNLIISRTRFFLTSILALIYAKLKKVKWIHIEHGSDFVQLSSRFKSLVAKFYDYTLGWLVFKCSDLNISISEAVQSFVYKFDKRKSPIIHRGIELDEIKNISPGDSFKPKDENTILVIFIGRLISGKGVPDLLNTASQIKNANVEYIIIGDGEEGSNLKNLVNKLNLSAKVTFLGHQPHDKAISLLKRADIFINPSYTEGLPTSVLEAAYCRKAIIATNVGGTSEIIDDGQNGYLIKPRDITSLKNKLEVLIKDKKLRSDFGGKAWEKITTTFNWKKSIKKYEQEIAKILARK